MPDQTATLTSYDTSARLQTVKVPFLLDEGEVPDLATLQRDYQLSQDGTPVPTWWYDRGPGHLRPDGNGNLVRSSLRLVYADAPLTVGPGSASPTTWTHELAKVRADNSATAAPTFPAWASTIRATVAYTDVNAVLGNTAVSVDVVAKSREGNPGDSWEVKTYGGTRCLEGATWIGPGRHHSALRLLGHNDWGDDDPRGPNTPVEVTGLLRVIYRFEIRSGDTFGVLHLLLIANAPYPFPAAPPDGGERDSRRPHRPTYLDPNASSAAHPYMDAGTWQGVSPMPAGEELERSPVLSISGLTVTVDHGTETLHWRPWYTANHVSGAGPWGTMPTSGNTTSIDVQGLRWTQGWALRGTLSSDSAAEAERLAADPDNFTGIPSYQAQLELLDTLELQGGEVDGDRLNFSGLLHPPIDTLSTAQLEGWLQRGNSLNWLATTLSSPWSRQPENSGDPNIGGTHFAVGWNHHGEAVFAGSPKHLYQLGGWALRHAVCRGGLFEHEALESLDWQTDDLHRTGYTCNFDGTVHFDTSEVQFGVRSSGDRNRASNAHFNGAPSPLNNPDTRGGGNQGENWVAVKTTHWGVYALFYTTLFRDCPMGRYLLRSWANITPHACPGGPKYPSPNNVRNLAGRGLGRAQDVATCALLLSDDAAWVDRLATWWAWRTVNWNNPQSTAAWRFLGGGNDNRTDSIDTSPCGITPYTNIGYLAGRQWIPWHALIAAWAAIRFLPFLKTEAERAEVATNVAYIAGYALESLIMLDPDLLSAAAERDGDACFAARAAQILATLGAGNPGIPVEGFLAPKSRAPVQTVPTYRHVTFELEMHSVSKTNGGVNSYFVLLWPLVRAFNLLRTRTGLIERLGVAEGAHRAIFPVEYDGEAYTRDIGYPAGEITYSGTPVIPGPAPDLTFSPPTPLAAATVTLDWSSSTFGGLSSGVLVDVWYHYAEVNPGVPDEEGVPWDTRTDTTCVYNAFGDYYPAVMLTQADGRSAIFRVNPPIPVSGGSSTTPPPVVAFDVSPDQVVSGATVELDLTGSSVQGDTSLATAQLWRNVVSLGANGLPTTPADFVLSWAELVEASYVTETSYGPGGFYFPAVLLTQADGQRTLVVDAQGVEVNTAAPMASIVPDTREVALAGPVNLEWGASTFGGPEAGASADVWDHYDEASPGLPDATGVAWTSTTTRATSYASEGTYHPAVLLTQADGRSSFYRDRIGVRAKTLPAATPPTSAISGGPFVDVLPGDLLELFYAGTGTLAESWLWEYSPDGGVTWFEFSTDRDPVLEAPYDATDLDIRCTATNGFGSDAATEAGYVTYDTPETDPTAAFELARTSWPEGAVGYPFPFLVVTANSSTNGTAYLWALSNGDFYVGELPPPFQLPGKGHHELTLYVSNSSGLAIFAQPLTVLSGEELEAEWDLVGYNLEAEWDLHRYALAAEWDLHGPPLFADTWLPDPLSED